MEKIFIEGYRLLGVYFVTVAILLMMLIYVYKFIQKMYEEHQKEREAWRKVTEEQFKIMNETFEKNTSILTALKVMLESKK